MRQRKNVGFGMTAIVVYIAAAIVATLVVYFSVHALQEPKEQVATASAANSSVGSILVPDHKGNCLKTSFNNRTGEMVDLGSVPCVSSGPANQSLPPNLEGFQKSFRAR
jgi:hypothetical protein